MSETSTTSSGGLPAMFAEKLEGLRNYGSWKFDVKCHLMHDDLWQYVEKTPLDTDKAGQRGDQKAFSKICLMVSKDCKVYVRSCKTAKQAWEALQTAFEDKGLNNRCRLLTKLVSVKLNHYSNMGMYVTEILNVAQQLGELGKSIDDELLAALMLAGLPDEYAPMRLAIENTNVTLTTDYIKMKLLQMSDYKESSSSSSEPATALTAKKKPFKKNYVKTAKKQTKCFICEGAHKMVDCPDNPRNKKNNKKERAHVATALAISKPGKQQWILDSGASTHMTSSKNLLIDFLNGYLTEKVYMRPPGFEENGKEDHICLLKRSLYGLKQSPRSWNQRLHKELMDLNFKQSLNEPCVYTRVRDPDSANGNTTKLTSPEPCKEVNKNETTVNNSKKTKSMAGNNGIVNTELCKNNKDDTDKGVGEVKLKQVDSPWKPRRLVPVLENLSEEELGTLVLYRKFRGILNKLTPTNFDTLLKEVLALEFNNQTRMEGVINLIFEKALKEPIFSEVYANLCLKLSSLKVPSDNNRDNVVTFRGLIICKCQTEFETRKSDEELMNMEKESAENAEPARKKELQMMIDEGNRKIRLRAVANVRFIGELYKLKMLTCKIMDYCMRQLIDNLEEVKLECLCELLATIGEQVENEGGSQLDPTYKKLQEIVDRKPKKISNQVRFMVQDVIVLRRKWIAKIDVDKNTKKGGSYSPSVQPSTSANEMKKTRKTRVFRLHK